MECCPFQDIMASFGLVGKLHLESDWSPAEVVTEIRTTFNEIMKDDDFKFLQFTGTGVRGNCVRQENVSGGTHFPRKFCPTGQDILSTLGQIVRVCF